MATKLVFTKVLVTNFLVTNLSRLLLTDASQYYSCAADYCTELRQDGDLMLTADCDHWVVVGGNFAQILAAKWASGSMDQTDRPMQPGVSSVPWHSPRRRYSSTMSLMLMAQILAAKWACNKNSS